MHDAIVCAVFFEVKWSTSPSRSTLATSQYWVAFVCIGFILCFYIYLWESRSMVLSW